MSYNAAKIVYNQHSVLESPRQCVGQGPMFAPMFDVAGKIVCGMSNGCKQEGLHEHLHYNNVISMLLAWSSCAALSRPKLSSLSAQD
jgi:hypothetical protein